MLIKKQPIDKKSVKDNQQLITIYHHIDKYFTRQLDLLGLARTAQACSQRFTCLFYLEQWRYSLPDGASSEVTSCASFVCWQLQILAVIAYA
jgi:hypothetical protein